MRQIVFIIFLSLLTCACSLNHSDNTVSEALINLELVKAYYYEKTGQLVLAEQTYKNLLQRAPGLGAAHNNYGVFLCRRSHYKRGIQQLFIASNDHRYSKRRMAFQNALRCKEKI